MNRIKKPKEKQSNFKIKTIFMFIINFCCITKGDLK